MRQTDPEGAASDRSNSVEGEREAQVLARLLETARETLTFVQGIGQPVLPLGFFANVIDLGHGLGLALSTDGVGTKLMIAQRLQQFDTVGIDCVAMNVNDVLCVGARPMAFLDYIAVQHATPELLDPLMRGLKEGARRAGVSICGGETAQIREMLASERAGWGCDLVGMCVGRVPLDQVIVGQAVTPGNVIMGLRSSGIHSNGLTLARQVLLQGRYTVDTEVDELGRTLGAELLEPTLIYVPEVVEALERSLAITGLAHITSDGLLNLLRLNPTPRAVGYVIDRLPPIPPIFPLIQHAGGIPDHEMFRVFNMGIGFCVVIAEEDAETFQQIVQSHGREAVPIGRVVSEPAQQVVIRPYGLVGHGTRFVAVGEDAGKLRA